MQRFTAETVVVALQSVTSFNTLHSLLLFLRRTLSVKLDLYPVGPKRLIFEAYIMLIRPTFFVIKYSS